MVNSSVRKGQVIPALPVNRRVTLVEHSVVSHKEVSSGTLIVNSLESKKIENSLGARKPKGITGESMLSISGQVNLSFNNYVISVINILKYQLFPLSVMIYYTYSMLYL